MCCENYIDLGCFNHCDDLDTGVIIPSNGDYKIFLEFNFGLTEYLVTGVAGDNFIIPDAFNENYIYTFNIYDANNVLLNDTCYRFRTKLTKIVNV